LDYIVEQSMLTKGVALSEVAAALSLQPSNMRNLLKTLEIAGYVGRAGKLYVPGPHCRSVVRAGRAGSELLAYLRPVIQAAASDLGESLVLATIINGQRQVLYRREGNAEIVASLSHNEGRNFYDLVTNQIIIAFMTEDERREIITLHGVPENIFPDVQCENDFFTLLDKLRQQGFAESYPSESMYALALPLLDGQGIILGSLGVYVPAFRASDAQKQLLKNSLRTIRINTECHFTE
ncbi:MAG: hypothetical protein RRY34_05465, partial [Victivallaceae bacterium]